MAAAPDSVRTARSDPDEAVFCWRLEQARHLGLRPPDDEWFAASDADLAHLRRLVDGGCDPHTACRILV